MLGLAKFAISSSSSSSSDEEDNEWEKREEYYSRLRRRDSEEDREEELERSVLAEKKKKKKGKFETTPNGLLQLWKDVDDDADIATTLSEFEELEYEDYDGAFEELPTSRWASAPIK